MVFAPFLGRFPVIVIWSPFLMMSRSQPCLVRTFGLLASQIYISIFPFSPFPFSSFAPTEMITWGLLNWKSVTVPFTVVNFVVSYADVPWCANMGAETNTRTANPANKFNNQFLMQNSYRKLSRSQSARHHIVTPAVP